MWAYPKHPCTQSFRSHGLAVGHIQRYPRNRIHTQEAPCIRNHYSFS